MVLASPGAVQVGRLRGPVETTGLDPRSCRDLRQIVRELPTDGVTIFLTTQ